MSQIDKFRTKLLSLTVGITIAYIFLLITDIIPLMRGPYDSNLNSLWPFYFVNTINKAWVFIPIYLLLAITTFRFEKLKKITNKNEVIILISLVFLIFLFQIALVYFSRFGINILFRRLVDPGINGYFSTAININSIQSFLSNFTNLVNERVLAQHASGHTPGAVIMIRGYINLISFFQLENLFSFISNLNVNFAKDLWDALTTKQKLASVTLPFVLHFLSSLVIIPFYYLSKLITKNTVVSFRSTLLFSIIPSFSFFALIFDPIYLFFPLLSFICLYKGVERKNYKFIVLSGLIIGLGLFFTASFLVYLAGLGLLASLYFIQYKKTEIIKQSALYVFGIILLAALLFIFDFNLFSALIATIHNQASRDYIAWLLYNPFDFFQYMSIPITIIFLTFSYLSLRNNIEKNNLLKKILISFWLIFIVLIASGASRGEVGRIWLPFMIFPVILSVNFITKYSKFSSLQFLIILTFIFLQVIVIEEFWVPIW